MSLIRYEPWSLFDQLRREMDTSLSTSDWVPAVDIKETDDHFMIVADIPGVAPEDIEVQMENGVLTIKGERETEKTEEKDDFKRIERSFGSFYRRFSLPETADPDSIEAKSHNGVLEITINKQEKTQPRKISVHH
jgi:HSP20 family protein